MNTNLESLLKRKMMRRSLLTAALPAAGMSMALGGQNGKSPGARGAIRLGGAWMASDGAEFIFSHTQIPLDPEGRAAALYLHILSYNDDGAGLIASLGGDKLSDLTGTAVMTDHNHAKAVIIGSVLKSGNPSVITALWQVEGTFEFTDPDTLVSDYTNSIYPSAADGLPHGSPLLSFPGATLTLKRLPAP